MNKHPAKTAAPLLSTETMMSATAGAIMGQLVLGIASHHEGSWLGLVLAMVFVLAASTSTTMFLALRHVAARPRGVRPPVQGWLLALGTAFLLSVQFSQF